MSERKAPSAGSATARANQKARTGIGRSQYDESHFAKYANFRFASSLTVGDASLAQELPDHSLQLIDVVGLGEETV
jgi:hypothetical protein